MKHAAKTQAALEGDFIATLGPAFLAHLLRRLSDRLIDADAAWHVRIGLDSPPRTSSTLLALARHGPLAVTALAKQLQQSHQLVQQWVGALTAAGFVEIRADPKDRRRSMVALTQSGVAYLEPLEQTIAAADLATARMLDEVAPGLEDQLWALERELRRRDLVSDVGRAYAGLTTDRGHSPI